MIAVFSLAGCKEAAAEEEVTETATTQKIKVAFCFDILDLNQTEFVYYTRYFLEQANTEQTAVEFYDFTAYDAKMSMDTQISQIETAIASGYNLIYTMSVDPNGIVPAFEKAYDANVDVVDMRGPSATNKVTAYLGSLEYDIGQEHKKHVKDLLDADPELVFNMCLLYPNTGSPGAFVRLDPQKELAEEMPGRINIIVEGYGNWNTEDSQKLMEDWIQTYLDMNIAIAANDESGLGAINALEAANMKDRVLVAGGNGGPQGIALVREGRMDWTIGFDKGVMGKLIADMALKIYDGTLEVDETGLYTPPTPMSYGRLVTKDNVEEWAAYVDGFIEKFESY